VSAYIDGPNLFHAGEMIEIRLDYRKIKSLITGNRVPVDLNYYCTNGKTPGEVSFFAKIQNFGYNLTLFPLHQYGSERPKEKMVDTQIVADSLVDGLVKNKFDLAVFGSGDKDILPAIRHLMHYNKQVEIMSFQHTLARGLKYCGARVINLSSILSKIQR